MMADSIVSVLVASAVDRRVGQELLKAIGPLGIEASLRAVEELNASGTAPACTRACRASWSNSSMRREKPLNSATPLMLAIGLQLASWREAVE